MFIIKIFLSVSVAAEARQAKRNSNLWSTLVFFFTGIVLIIYGLKKKKILPKDWRNYTNTEMSRYLDRYATILATEVKDFYKALSILTKALELDLNNHSVYDTRSYIEYELKDYQSAPKDAITSIEMKNDMAVYYYNRGFILLEIQDKKAVYEDFRKAFELRYKLAFKPIHKYCKEFVSNK